VAGKLVVVTAIATNIGKESDSPYLIMKLQDSQGNKFAKAAAVYQIDAPSGSKATDFILPGQTRNIQLGVFDVAPDAMGLKLVVQDGFKELEVDPMP
jgi:hypothetical protein